MTYEQTLEFLFNQLPAYHRIGKAAYKNNLDNTLMLDELTGHPHKSFLSIHVAGTNGKGSVSHLIASVLQEAGYKTGLYTSPHLINFRERIKINGVMIPESEVTGFVENNFENIKSIQPSFFEICVAMAFDFFAKSKIDIAVIEVGLGGRLDSTNIIDPVLSVITNIGFDHTDLLGETLEEIAVEKAGIIKKNVPVVISESQAETKDVFNETASENGSEISFADQNFSCILDDDRYMKGKRKFFIRDVLGKTLYEGITVLTGDYQIKNLTAVCQVFKTLSGKLNISKEHIINGIAKVSENTGLAGRWQILGHKPLIICDTGHNKEGLEYVLQQLERIPKTGLHIIIGFVNDKDVSSILPMFPRTAVYYFTKASIPRAMDEYILLEKAVKSGLNGNSYPDVKSAMKAAFGISLETDVVFIGGSTFIVADALL